MPTIIYGSFYEPEDKVLYCSPLGLIIDHKHQVKPPIPVYDLKKVEQQVFPLGLYIPKPLHSTLIVSP